MPRIEDSPIIVVQTVALHAADDLEAQPRLVVAIVLALIANDAHALARLQEHLDDGTIIDTVVIANEKPAGRLPGFLIECLPKPGCRRLRAQRMTGDKR